MIDSAVELEVLPEVVTAEVGLEGEKVALSAAVDVDAKATADVRFDPILTTESVVTLNDMWILGFMTAEIADVRLVEAVICEAAVTTLEVRIPPTSPSLEEITTVCHMVLRAGVIEVDDEEIMLDVDGGMIDAMELVVWEGRASGLEPPFLGS